MHPCGRQLKGMEKLGMKEGYSRWSSSFLSLLQAFVAVLHAYISFPTFSVPAYRLVCKEVYREEKPLHHISMVAKFLDDNKPKIHLKSKFAPFQT